jgi:hypothetical protein
MLEVCFWIGEGYREERKKEHKGIFSMYNGDYYEIVEKYY